MADTLRYSNNNFVHSFAPPSARDCVVAAPPPRRAFNASPVALSPISATGMSVDYGDVIRSLKRIGPIQYDQEVTNRLTVAADVLKKDLEERNRARQERMRLMKQHTVTA